MVNVAKEVSNALRTGSAQLINTTQAKIQSYDGGDLTPVDGSVVISYGSYPSA
ncbi:hypothetical protein D3C77_793710 [compost metagenome]